MSSFLPGAVATIALWKSAPIQVCVYDPSKSAPLHWGGSGPNFIHGFLSPHPKRYFDRFSRFSRADARGQQTDRPRYNRSNKPHFMLRIAMGRNNALTVC